MKVKSKKPSLREEVESLMNGEESEILDEEEMEEISEREEENTATLRLQAAVHLVKSRFNLGDTFSVTKFNDRGEKGIDLTMQNHEFSVSVTVFDPMAYSAFEI